MNILLPRSPPPPPQTPPSSLIPATSALSYSYSYYLSLLSHPSTLTLTLPQTKSIHAHLFKHHLIPHNVTLTLRLYSLYSSLSPSPSLSSLLLNPLDLLTFNLLIKSFSSSDPLLALQLFDHLLRSDFSPDQFTLPPILNACASLRLLPFILSIQAYAVKSNLATDPFVGCALIDAYAKCGQVQLAVQLLDEMPDPDLPTYNSAISGLSKQGDYGVALRVFSRLREAGLGPNRTTLSGAITACGRLLDKRLGRAIHAHVVKAGEGIRDDVSVNSALIFMYPRFGDLESAQFVFHSMPDRNVVSWNAMINAQAQGSKLTEAWALFVEMLIEGYEASEVTLTCMVAVSQKLLEGKMIHGFVTKVGLVEEEIIGAALIDMYVRLSSLVDARKLFDEIPRSEMGSWNSLILGYSRNGYPREALNLFFKLKNHADLRPNSITLIGALSACAALGMEKEGKEIHDYIVHSGIKVDQNVNTSLIEMYSKCGNVEVARKLFEGLEDKDLVAWSVMISGYGVNGQVKEAMELFDRMSVHSKIKPDNVTFTSLLSACSHAGMVKEGWYYFNTVKVYGLEPKTEQYACMVDLLGRAGKLDQALEFIEKMPVKPDASVWGALLGACKIHNNVDLGIFAAEKLFELDTKDAGHFILLSNLYAATGRWKDVKKVREEMKSRGLQKPPGCSWVDMDDRIHEFYVGDKSHPQSEKIYAKLDELGVQMRELGHIPDTNLVLHDVDDEVKEEKLSSHSERLAIAFALINTKNSEPIRVTKNLRVCVDCHRVTKLISKITQRKIVVRDARRFHHFEEGQCSCGDYW